MNTKPKERRKENWLAVRVSESEAEQVRADAARSGLSLSNHIRDALGLDTISRKHRHAAG